MTLESTLRAAILLGVLLAASPALTQNSNGIAHKIQIDTELQGLTGKELKVIHTTYAPEAKNPRHYHTDYVIFDVTGGTGMVQEDGKPPVTLKAGDSLLIPPGTIHSHWNPSTTEPWAFTEIVIKDKWQRSTVPMQPLGSSTGKGSP